MCITSFKGQCIYVQIPVYMAKLVGNHVCINKTKIFQDFPCECSKTDSSYFMFNFVGLLCKLVNLFALLTSNCKFDRGLLQTFGPVWKPKTHFHISCCPDIKLKHNKKI